MDNSINPFAWTETVCPIAALPEDKRKLVLWNMTCWPFDFATACEQLSEIARKLNAGISIDEQWAETEADIERVMAQYEEAHG